MHYRDGCHQVSCLHCIGPTTERGLQGKRPKSPGVAAAAEMLGFRAFRLQQEALEAASASAAAATAQHRAEVPETLPAHDERSAAGATVPAAAVAPAAAAAEAEAGVYGRLYESALTSQRRKAAFARAAVAGELAALQGAAPRPLPLPAQPHHESETPRPTTPGARLGGWKLEAHTMFGCHAPPRGVINVHTAVCASMDLMCEKPRPLLGT